VFWCGTAGITLRLALIPAAYSADSLTGTMKERRLEQRLLCADLVEVEWKDPAGRTRRTVANLEDISASGACLQVETEIPLDTPVVIRYPQGDLSGEIRYCVYREIGYYLGVRFDQGLRWDESSFRPLHLFDPNRLKGE
jgi:hypothetical protein